VVSKLFQSFSLFFCNPLVRPNRSCAASGGVGPCVPDHDALRPHEQDRAASIYWTCLQTKPRTSVSATLCDTRHVLEEYDSRPMAHARRYLARDSATQEHSTKQVGFDSSTESIDIATRLGTWQKDRDQRLWKLIISPEFGERIDLRRLTRELLSRMEKDPA
jgi:hypothetical protein